MYNVTADSWKTLRNIPVGDKHGPSCAQIPQRANTFLVAGGISASDFDSAIYDASTDTWKKTANTKFSRWFSRLVVLGKRIFVLGGETGFTTQHTTVEEYLVDKDVWEVKSVKIPGRTLSSVLSLPAKWFADVNKSKQSANRCLGVV